MANSTVKDVMRIAILQNGYKESPAGSNKTKFGKAMGMNGVPWCAEYVYWCGEQPSGDNPIPKSANAATLQDLIVSQKGGSWVMPKTASNSAKKKGLEKVKFGDVIDFDFGKNNLYRQHVGFAIGRIGNYYITIEGNTSAEGKSGSQSNGGQVAIRRRHYTQVCSNARPKYGKTKAYTPAKAYDGAVPTLPKRGYFDLGDKGKKVEALQYALNWSVDADIKVDGVFGNETLFGVFWFQVQSNGRLVPDGQFGKECLMYLEELIEKHKDEPKPKPKKTTAEKIVAWAKKIAKDGTYHYKKWNSKDKATQICPICNKQKEPYHGWNCIGFVSAADYHGGGLKNIECSCKGLGDDNFFTKVTLGSWKKRNGENWKMISNGGSKGGASIKADRLKAGDNVICYDGNGKFKHIVVYIGDGKYIDSTGSAKPNIGIREYSALTKKYHCTRAFRPIDKE